MLITTGRISKKKVPMQELKEVTQNFEFIDFASYPSFDVFFYVFV